jgi:hypothetical protein
VKRALAQSVLLALAAMAGQGCTPTPPPGFRPSNDTEQDTGGWDGSYDPLSWLHDHWAATAEVCQPPAPFTSPGTWEPFYEDECQDALMADLKLDLESFTETTQGPRAMEALVEGAFYLLGRDLGGLGDLQDLEDETDRWAIRDPFIEQALLVADVLDVTEVRRVLYNLVMSTILETRYAPDIDYSATFTLSSRTLRYRGQNGTGASHACLLVHEATHGWQDIGHVECPENHIVDGTDYSGQKLCDPDWAGAFGFEAAAARLMVLGAQEEDPGYTEEPLGEMEHSAAMILED